MTTLPLFSPVEEVVESSGELTPEQVRAVELRGGPVFVHAGAGSGKTSVLVERFVRAVLEERTPVERVLAITFTEKAAAELRARVRRRFLEAGEREHARAAESAWVSTIHGFCSRLLRAHTLSAGLDPDFRVLAEAEGDRLADDAFEAALEAFLAERTDRTRIGLVAAYGADRLAEALRAVHAQARTRGEREPTLPQPLAPGAEQLAAAHERLDRAVRAARDALAGDAPPGRQVHAVLAKLDDCASALEGRAAGGRLEPCDLDDLEVRRGSARAFRHTAFDELEHAHGACLELCSRARAAADLRLLDELLRDFARRYERAKAERSALDFDDLELLARDLLARRPALRERVRARFDRVLVDELQDTNRLQNEIVDQLTDGNLFTVGDELQSIYGFRGADLGVFAERRARAEREGDESRLSVNFRSRVEIVDVLDASFASVLGPGFVPLRAASEASPPSADPCVELLAVDRASARWEETLAGMGKRHQFGAAMVGVAPWRAAEARLLAARVGELVARGKFRAGEIAVMLRSWSDAGRYERALAERGLPTYVAGGGGYWGGLEVGDLRAYLAVLANPLDEEALVSVLASPLVGVSLDTLAALGLAGPRRHGGLWRVLHRSFLPEDARGEPDPDGRASQGDPGLDADALRAAIPHAEHERLEAFARRLSGERREMPRRSVAELVERAVLASGYDRAVLALPGGERRLANVRKLKRLAREFEATDGRDLTGFLAWIDRRDAASVREGDAPLEGEDLDAVRLMTIHAAKGLEFPVACVADLGRTVPPDAPLVRVSADGRIGLRIPRPEGGGLDALDAPALAAEQRAAEAAEERRLLWVAATRAQHRLIVSGALDLESPPRAVSPPMGWLAPALVPELLDAHRAGEHAGVCTREWEGREARLAWRLLTPASVGRLLPPADRDPAEAPNSGGGSAEAASALEPRLDPSGGESGSPPPPGVTPAQGKPVARVSYSGLESYRRCGYRFYLERTLGLSTARYPGPAKELDPLARGALAHELLERVDFRRPAPPTAEEVGARLSARGMAPRRGDIDALRGLVEGFISSPLLSRVSEAKSVRTELPFTFPLELGASGEAGRAVMVEGVIDVLCREGAGVLLVDYKSDRVDCDTDLERVCAEAYSVQRLVYALAALRDGAERVDVAHAFLERPHEPVLARFGAGDRSRLEQEVRELVRGLVEGRFEPTSSPGRELCAGCPGRAALCSWPPDRTGGPVAGDRPGPRTPPSSASESPAQDRSRGRGSVRPAA